MQREDLQKKENFNVQDVIPNIIALLRQMRLFLSKLIK